MSGAGMGFSLRSPSFLRDSPNRGLNRKRIFCFYCWSWRSSAIWKIVIPWLRLRPAALVITINTGWSTCAAAAVVHIRATAFFGNDDEGTNREGAGRAGGAQKGGAEGCITHTGLLQKIKIIITNSNKSCSTSRHFFLIPVSQPTHIYTADTEQDKNMANLDDL